MCFFYFIKEDNPKRHIPYLAQKLTGLIQIGRAQKAIQSIGALILRHIKAQKLRIRSVVHFRENFCGQCFSDTRGADKEKGSCRFFCTRSAGRETQYGFSNLFDRIATPCRHYEYKKTGRNL